MIMLYLIHNKEAQEILSKEDLTWLILGKVKSNNILNCHIF